MPVDGSLAQTGISLAVAWSFTEFVVPDQIDAARFARIAEYTAYAEDTDAFISTPMT